MGYFNLDPSTSVCHPCPGHATCVVNTTRFSTANGIIAPQDGYYHSSAFSDQVPAAPLGCLRNYSQFLAILLVCCVADSQCVCVSV